MTPILNLPGSRMRPKEGHDGLNDGADDGNEADGRMRVVAELLEGVEAFESDDDDGADEGHDDGRGHEDLMKPGANFMSQKLRVKFLLVEFL